MKGVLFRPASGELLSSWMSRINARLNLPMERLPHEVLGYSHLWTRDVDRGLPLTHLHDLERVFGLEPDSLERHTFARYQVFVGGQKSGVVPWLMPLGIYHRNRMGHAVSYCPQCLAERAVFTTAWRFAFGISCRRHGLRLHDACPACDAPVCLHRAALRHRRLDLCFSCGSALTQASRVQEKSDALIDFEMKFLRSSISGERILPDMPAAAGLRVLHAMANALSTGRLPPQSPSPGFTARRVECLRVGQRRSLLRALAEWIDRWPIKLIESMERGVICPSRLVDARCIPSEIFKGIPSYLQPRRRPQRVQARALSRAQVEALFRRSELDLTPYETRRLAVCYVYGRDTPIVALSAGNPKRSPEFLPPGIRRCLDHPGALQRGGRSEERLFARIGRGHLHSRDLTAAGKAHRMTRAAKAWDFALSRPRWSALDCLRRGEALCQLP